MRKLPTRQYSVRAHAEINNGKQPPVSPRTEWVTIGPRQDIICRARNFARNVPDFRGDRMRKVCVAAILSFVVLGSGIAWATECSPHCDYVHDYGPYDFSYVRPGLAGYPVCDWRGNCAPHIVYYQAGRRRPGVRIIIRPTNPNR